jgi:GNAT superfamily N-acetyltransferase
MRIRAAMATDADAVFGMLTRFVTSYVPDRAAFNRAFPALATYERAFLCVADEDGNLAGYVLAVEFDTLFANGPLVQVEELFVDEAHRGQAVGRQLIEASVDWARSRGAREVTVPTRRAGAYYVRRGFEETAGYYRLLLAP